MAVIVTIDLPQVISGSVQYILANILGPCLCLQAACNELVMVGIMYERPFTNIRCTIINMLMIFRYLSSPQVRQEMLLMFSASV